METEAALPLYAEDEKLSLPDLSRLPIPLERDLFLRTLLQHLSGALQDIIGIDQAATFVSIVGQKMADDLNACYRKSLAAERLSPEQVAAVCVDLKRRIQGDFQVLSLSTDKIVFRSRSCPFGDKVRGRPSLCMMTSNVFGSIAAENLGYGKVVIDQAIARGDDSCMVTVYLSHSKEAQAKPGREYFGVN